MIKRFTVHLVRLDPTVGSEMQKTRPCVVVSPDELNAHLRTALVAPLTSTDKGYVSRIPCQFSGREGWVALDQLRCADHARFIRRLGSIDHATQTAVTRALQEMFS